MKKYIIVSGILFRLETLQTMFVIVAGIMGALGLMILFVGFLTTGVTREKVYRAWRAQISGRISCIVVRILMVIFHKFCESVEITF